MNNEIKLISIFRTFIQKSLIPQIRKNDGDLHDWNRFTNMLNPQTYNINELQNYVDSLSPLPNMQRKDLSLTGKKKQDKNYNQHLQSFSANKTFGGQRSKHLVTGLRQTENQNKYQNKAQTYKDLSHQKQYSQGKQYHSGREDSFRRSTPNSLQSIGGSPQGLYQPVNVLSSLDRLLKGLMENQQRLQMLEGRGS